MWVPPGQSANHSLWRYDVAQKSFLPPNVPGNPKGIQVEMPQGYTGTEPRGFHMLASPAGTQAPVEHVNYTPETGEVSGRGAAAPADKLNYTLMPQEALTAGAGQGQGSSPAMGAGAAVPALGATDTPQQFAGTPPMAGSPTMMGPSPTTNAAMMRWGGGGTPFDSRMGMGAEGDPPNLMDTTNPTGDSGSSQPNTVAPGTQGPAAVQGQAQGNGATPSSSNVPKNVNGQPAVNGDIVRIIYGNDGKPIVYMIYDSQDLYDNPKFRWQAGNSADKGITTHVREDGTIDIIDPNKSGAEMVTNHGTPDANLVAKAEADRKVQDLNLQIKDLELKAAQGKDANSVALATADLQKAQADAKTAQSNADRAAVEAGLAGQAKPEAKPAKIIGSDRQIYILNTATDRYEPTGISEPGDAGDWEKYTDPKTQTVRLFNKTTREDVELAPVDQYKEYPPQKSTDGSGNWIQWDPGQQKFKVVYSESPDTTTEWSGDQLISINKATKQVTPIWTKKLTQAENDAHDEAIDKHNTALATLEKTKQDLLDGRITTAKARVDMETSLQSLLHPKPTQLTAGSVYIPPGLDVNIEDTDPFSGKSSTRHVSGGAQDPRVQAMISQIDQYLGPSGGLATAPGSAGGPALQTGGQATDTTGGAATTTTTTDKAVTAVGEGKRVGDDTQSAGDAMTGQPAGAAYKPGWPGSDPRLSGAQQPPTKRTNAAGDVITYDAQGNPIAPAVTDLADQTDQTEQTDQTDQTEQPAQPAGGLTNDYFLPSGRRNPAYGEGNEGMGAGMSAGGAGWTPRPGPFAPATGPGFLGAGQTEQPFSPTHIFDPKDVSSGHKPGIDLPKLPGHIANPGEIAGPGPLVNTGPGVSLPNVTDKGADWLPGLRDLVTQKVNESLRELLGWPKLEETPPTSDPLIGTQGGHDQPEIDPYDIVNKKALGPQEPTDVGKKNPNVKDISHVLGEGGTGPEDWAEQEAEGMASGAGKNVDPAAQEKLNEMRQQLQTTGTGQEPEPPGMMPPSGAPLQNAQTPPQGSGGQQPPQWLLTLLKAHPELLRMAGLQGQAAGGVSPPGQPAAGWQPSQGAGAEPFDPSQFMPLDPQQVKQAGGWGEFEGGSTGNLMHEGGGYRPYGPQERISMLKRGVLGGGQDAGQEPPTPPTDGTAPPAMGAPPVAPSPEGGPMTPPLDPSDVAGIGHRFGQDMNVGEPQHSGVDLQAPEGTPTQSPVDGFVARVENNPEGLGVTVVIHGMDGSEHRLGHLKSTSAYAGQQVKMGQSLGSPVGDTGMTTGAHLHWGVRDENGKPADPTQALGPMASMPPVPGTEMMGPPGGVGGQAQQGAVPPPPGGSPFPPGGGGLGGGNVGWRPRVGTGQTNADLANTQPYQVRDPMLQDRFQSLAGGYQPWGSQSARLDRTRPMRPIDITPGAMGTGQAQGRMGAGANTDWSALQNQLQQTWNVMSQAQMSPGQMGARMAAPGSMFGVTPRPPQPPPTVQQPQPPTMQGAAPQGPSVGSQMGQALSPAGRGGGAFSQAGAMPTGKPMPMGSSMPKGQTLPASATPQTQQAGWAPQ